MRLWAACVLLAAGSSPARSASPYGDLSRSDVTERIAGALPFLKEGLRFWDVYAGKKRGEGEPHTLLVELPDGRTASLKRTEDLARLVDDVATSGQALAYVRFMSDPPASRRHPIAPFEDVGFRELAEAVALEGDVTLRIDAAALRRLHLGEPRVRRLRAAGGRRAFEVSRYVLPDALVERLRRAYERGDEPPSVAEIALAVERVDPSGKVERALHPVGVLPFKVRFTRP